MFEQTFKNVNAVLWKEGGCTTDLDYTEQISWLRFLKYLDGLEEVTATEAQLDGKNFAFILERPRRRTPCKLHERGGITDFLR